MDPFEVIVGTSGSARLLLFMVISLRSHGRGRQSWRGDTRALFTTFELNYDMPLSPTTIFWPAGCKIDGICYGWLTPSICVAGVIAGSAYTQDPNILLTTLSRSETWKAIKKSCGGDPVLLGTCSFDKHLRLPLPSAFELFGNITPLEISYVLYQSHEPRSLRFYALENPQRELASASHSDDSYGKIAKYDFSRRICQNNDKAINNITLNQLNSSAVMRHSVQLPSASPKLLPVTASVLLTLASYLGSLAAVVLSLSKLVKLFTDACINPFGTPRYMSVKDVSAVVQQIDVRVEQALFFVNHVTTLNRRDTSETPSYSVRYTSFFNTVWLILNDISIGIAFSTFLSENSAALALQANSAIQAWLFDFPLAGIQWLDAWPAGLKLNAQLSRFYVNTFTGVIDTWRYLIPPLTPYHFVLLSSLASVGGFTLILAVSSDFLSLVTAHLRIAYEISCIVYRGAGVRLGGGLLWGVFRGKRRNVLRGRTDAWTYDIDQLLFGTVLFTLIAFLFPTALVYYVLFAGIRLATLLTQASIETMLAFMHHFPLFALMLRIKDPQRLPGGVYFKHSTLLVSESTGQCHVSYLVLKNQPITLSSIFSQYIELWGRLAHYYNPLRLLYQVLAGQHLSSIPGYSIRYAAASSDPSV